MIRLRYLGLLYIISLLFPLQLAAQIKTLDPILNPDQFKIHQIGPEEGMCSPFLRSAFQDKYGYLWIGTDYGLDMYDGYKFRNIRYRESDSVSSQILNVMHLLEDPDGGLWICSINNGLYYYDRTRDEMTVRKPLQEYPDSNANGVTGIFLDSGGLYWVFTWGGLYHFDRKADTFWYTGIPYTNLWNNLVNIEDFSLLELEDGTVWIPTSAGLHKYAPGTGEFSTFRHDPDNPNSISSDNVTSIILDDKGDLWITTLGGGLNILEGPDYMNFKHLRYRPGKKNTIFGDSLNTLMMDRSGNIWIAGIGGFSVIGDYNSEVISYRIRKKEIDYSRAQFDNDIVKIREDKDGHMWFMQEGSVGILYFNPISGQLYQFADVLKENEGLTGGNRLFELLIDQSGSIWVLTENGINIIEKQPVKPFHLYSHASNTPGTINHPNVMSVYVDSESTLWVGCFGPVLNRCSEFSNNLPRDFKQFPIYDQLFYPDMVMSMAERDSKSLWIGTYNGLFIFNKNSEKYTKFPNERFIQNTDPRLNIDGLYTDQRGFLWIGTRYSGLNIYDPATDIMACYGSGSNLTDSLPQIWNFAFCEDGKGNMWIGNFDHGISMLPKDEIPKIFSSSSPEFKRFRKIAGDPRSLSSDQVVDVLEDQSNRLWFATTDGLNLFDQKNNIFYHFNESDGLPHDCILGILQDDHGNLWISTLNGICKIVLEDGYGKDIMRSVHAYGSYEGIEKPVFMEKSRAKSPDGWMYFGGISGLTVFHPDSIKDNSVLPPVFITSILVNDRDIREHEKPMLDVPIPEAESIRLKFRDNFLAFEFIALNYLNAGKNQYRYMMEGLDEQWVEAGTRRFAEYRDLKPGEYTFRVIAANEDGLWNEEGDSIGIIIIPPWYRTIIAYLAYLLLIAAAVYGYLQWRTQQYKKEKDELEKLVKERTTTIQDQNKAILNANTQLEEQKEELEQQTEELTQQKEELQITLDRLKEAQDQLIQSEKLAALGGLVAGVAHEINTPVGISVTAASNLVEETKVMAEKYKANKISKADFKEYLSTANQSAKLILANMERTAEMVQSFKQISADQSTGEKRRVVLRSYLEDIIRSLYPKLKGRSVSINLDIDPNLEIDSYPGAFSQMFTNLVLNSLIHAFSKSDNGIIVIQAEIVEGELNINYSDNGAGIQEENRKRIFEPFFTTNKKVGTGLGLNIVYNLVTQKLNGTIECESEMNKGTSFQIRFPI